MKKINLNELAKLVAKREGGKKQMSIAQIKECMKCTFIELNNHRPSEMLEAIERYSLIK